MTSAIKCQDREFPFPFPFPTDDPTSKHSPHVDQQAYLNGHSHEMTEMTMTLKFTQLDEISYKSSPCRIPAPQSLILQPTPWANT